MIIDSGIYRIIPNHIWDMIRERRRVKKSYATTQARKIGGPSPISASASMRNFKNFTIVGDINTLDDHNSRQQLMKICHQKRILTIQGLNGLAFSSQEKSEISADALNNSSNSMLIPTKTRTRRQKAN